MEMVKSSIQEPESRSQKEEQGGVLGSLGVKAHVPSIYVSTYPGNTWNLELGTRNLMRMCAERVEVKPSIIVIPEISTKS